MDMRVGSVLVATSSNGGHSPEFYADRLLARIIHVSDTAPEPIKAQALHYKDSLHTLILETIKSAVASERATIMHELGQPK